MYRGVRLLQTLRAHLFALALATLLPAGFLLGYSIYADAQNSAAEAKSSLRTLVRIAAAGTSRFLDANAGEPRKGNLEAARTRIAGVVGTSDSVRASLHRLQAAVLKSRHE